MIGLARMIVMPFDRFGRIASVDPHANAVGMAAGSGSELPAATLACSRPFRYCGGRVRSAFWCPLRGVDAAPDTLHGDDRTIRPPRAAATRVAAARAVVRRSSGTWTLQSRCTATASGPSPASTRPAGGRARARWSWPRASCARATRERLDGLTDSKLLTPAAREEYYDLILRRCADSGRSSSSRPRRSTGAGVHVTNIEGMRRAVAGSPRRPGTC